jgi:hypothetical protein
MCNHRALTQTTIFRSLSTPIFCTSDTRSPKTFCLLMALMMGFKLVRDTRFWVRVFASACMSASSTVPP